MASSTPLVSKTSSDLRFKIAPRHGLHRFAFGISGELVRIDRRSVRALAANIPRVLVEVEAQAGAAAERRMILMQVANRVSRLKHGPPHTNRFSVSLNPSVSARVMTVFAIPRKPLRKFLYGDDLHEIEHAQAAAEARHSAVGSTWFGPDA